MVTGRSSGMAACDEAGSGARPDGRWGFDLSGALAACPQRACACGILQQLATM